MIKQLHLFFNALSFYTRIPSPKWVRFHEGSLSESVYYLPLVGWIVGGFSALMLVGCLQFLPPALSVVLAMTCSIFLTGAFHEDALADVCDGFGGGWTKERILEIMKDSRLGTYGVVGLFLILALKLVALLAVVDLVAPAHLSAEVFLVLVLLSGHAMSRFVTLTTLITHQYVREDDNAKAKPAVKGSLRWWHGSVCFAFIIGVAPLVCLQTYWMLVPLLLMLFSKVWLCRFFYKWIGGYTGDCLGCIQQVSEVIFYVGLIGIWRFI